MKRNALGAIAVLAIVPLTAVAGAAPLGAAPSPAPTALVTATPNPALVARAKNCFLQLQAGKIDRSQLASAVSAQISDGQLKQVASTFGKLGAPVTFEQQQTGVQGNVSYSVFLVTFGNGTKVDFLFAVDPRGKITNLRISAP